MRKVKFNNKGVVLLFMPAKPRVKRRKTDRLKREESPARLSPGVLKELKEFDDTFPSFIESPFRERFKQLLLIKHKPQMSEGERNRALTQLFFDISREATTGFERLAANGRLAEYWVEGVEPMDREDERRQGGRVQKMRRVQIGGTIRNRRRGKRKPGTKK